jgi:ParB family chromosome partitioning protein
MAEKYSNELFGPIEDVNINDIVPPTIHLRRNTNDIQELAESIKKIGLLQPIVVRINSLENYEIVAGNRRFKACKKLGRRKIACHLVELDDKAAFEVSIIENVQRHTLNPIDEALAFRKYVNEFGWEGISDLAQKLSKSPSYICKRMKLVEVPKDVIELVSKSEIDVTVAEELLPITDRRTQSNLTRLIQDRNLSLRKVRKTVREIRTKKLDKVLLNHFTSTGDYEITI